MKKIIFLLMWFYFSMKNTYANDAWIFEWSWVNSEKLRTWEISLDDIPNMIVAIINFWMWVAWTIAVIFIIFWAYQILFGSIENDKTKWKNTIIMAIFWFVIASLAWFIIRLIIDNFSSTTI